MIHYVYAIVNSNGEYEHIGETKNLRKRFNLHVCKNGKFKRDEVSIKVLKSFSNRIDAFNYQCYIQNLYGFKTDNKKCSESAKKVKDKRNRKPPQCIKTTILVYDIKTNKLIGEYKNQSDTARALGISQTLISYILLGKQSNSKKYRFEYKK